MLNVNLSQMSRWKVTSDNVKYYDTIVKCHGKVVSLDYRPYVILLTEFNIFFTAPEKHK